MTKPISALMRADITVIDFNATIDQVENVMVSEGFSFLPVIDTNSGYFGVISYSDIVRFHCAGKNPKAERVWELCTHNVLEVTSDTPIIEVANLMLAHNFHHVVVIENKQIQGVVSSMDFVAEYIKQNATV